MLKLYGEPECWKFKADHPEEFASFGCGPGDGIGNWLVPDTAWGLSLKPACTIHDWYYRFYSDRSEVGKKLADVVFANNMVRIVNHHTKKALIRRFRLMRVEKYYKAVRAFGGPAWYEDDNPSDKYKAWDTS